MLVEYLAESFPCVSVSSTQAHHHVHNKTPYHVVLQIPENEMGEEKNSVHTLLWPSINEWLKHEIPPFWVFGQDQVESSIIVRRVVYDLLCAGNIDVDCLHYPIGEVSPVEYLEFELGHGGRGCTREGWALKNQKYIYDKSKKENVLPLILLQGWNWHSSLPVPSCCKAKLGYFGPLVYLWPEGEQKKHWKLKNIIATILHHDMHKPLVKVTFSRPGGLGSKCQSLMTLTAL